MLRDLKIILRLCFQVIKENMFIGVSWVTSRSTIVKVLVQKKFKKCIVMAIVYVVRLYHKMKT